MKFYILDVFAEEKLAGNQLAVIRGNPSTEQMHKWAQEMNYSETTFITSDEPEHGGYNTRIFTPEVEFEFAGHPTLGTAYVVREEIIGEPVDEVILNEKVGQIPVQFGDDGVLWMQQKSPQFGTTYAVKDMAMVLNLLPDEMDEQFPIQEVSTGTAFVMIPVKTLHAVERAEVDLSALKKLFAQTDRVLNADALFLFCPQTLEADTQIHARAFVHLHGIPEDPATGSANGCFAGWMVQYGYLGSQEVDVSVEQGYEMKRPSRLYLKASLKDDVFDIRVGGRVQLVGRGDLVD